MGCWWMFGARVWRSDVCEGVRPAFHFRPPRARASQVQVLRASLELIAAPVVAALSNMVRILHAPAASWTLHASPEYDMEDEGLLGGLDAMSPARMTLRGR